jgi:hypothetical protein
MLSIKSLGVIAFFLMLTAASAVAADLVVAPPPPAQVVVQEASCLRWLNQAGMTIAGGGAIPMSVVTDMLYVPATEILGGGLGSLVTGRRKRNSAFG